MDLKTLSFAGRTALVTGGAQGIGQAIARQLAELDAKVIILDVNAEKAEETCREIGCGCSFRRVDLSDGDALSAAMERLIREVERVDVLINNAGVVNTSDFETLSRADWDRVLAIDLTAVFLTSQAVFRNMTTNKYVVLLILNLILLVLGCLMEGNSILVMMVPLMLPLIQACGMDLLQFGVMACINIYIGCITPPVGVSLLVGTKIGDTSMGSAFKAILPFLGIALIILVLVTYIPSFSLWLPYLGT